MKVVLLKDEKKLGKKGDIVNVADGYAISALLPQKKAKIATPSVLKQAEKEQAKKKEEELKQKEVFEKNAKKLSGNAITVAVNAEGEKVFGSVGANDIVEAVKVKFQIELDEKSVPNEHFKTLGEQEIDIDFGFGVKTKMILKIVAK